MRRIYNNSDIKFNVDSDLRIGKKFIIKFYTQNKDFNFRKTSEDVVNEVDEDGNTTRFLKLNWSELSTIGYGVLNYVVNNLADDAEFDDAIYNDTFSRTTTFYISSNLDVTEGESESFSQMLADLQSKQNELEVALDNEIERSTGVDDEFSDKLGEETTRATDAETTLQNNIDALESKHDADVVIINAAISDEATARKNADDEIIIALNTEIERATKKEGELSDAIDALESKHDEDIAALAGSLADEVERAKGAEKTNADAISAETARATSKEDEIAGDLTTEVARATKAESDEAKARANADTTLQSNIDAEVTRATGAEADLQSEIDALTTTVGDNLTATNKAIADEAKVREDADAALTTSLADEVERAKGAEKTNADAISAETARAEGVEQGLTDKITSLTNRVSADEQSTASNIEQIYTTYNKRFNTDEGYINELYGENTKRKSDIATLQSTKQDNLSGTDKQIKIVNNVVGFADDAVWICGDY